LQGSFPDAARAALVASTREGLETGSVDRLTAFLRTQLGARTLAPKAGDDPDAVLSRAEAALGRGDLDETAAELAGLPDAGKAEFTGWLVKLNARRGALAALADLGAQLDPN